MKTHRLSIVYVLIGLVVLAGCAPSDEVAQFISTQISGDIFATQTASLLVSTPTIKPTSTQTPARTTTDTPTPEFTATPTPAIIQMKSDGSGDYESLDVALESAPEGATIQLGPGVFQLEKQITIRHSLTIIGSGMGVTEIDTEQKDYDLQFMSDGLFILQDLTIRRTKNVEADMLVIHDGQLSISHIQIIGGKPNYNRPYITCLDLGGRVTGEVRDSVFTKCSDAIFPNDGSRVTLENNYFFNNQTGIDFYNGSTGVARKNTIIDNEIGIAIGYRARPTLEENWITSNTAGIMFYSYSEGLARNNYCSRNWWGIMLFEQAKPTIEGNICNNNEDAGIIFDDDSGGSVAGNECAWNKTGIQILSKADPTLNDNNCHDNSWKDIDDPRKD